MKMLLEASELTKDERESQLYDEFKHFRQNKGETIHECYVRGLKQFNYDQLYAYLKQHEAHANENKMMLERYNQHAIDPLAFVSNVSPQQYPTQSSTIPPSASVPPVIHQPRFTDNTYLDLGLLFRMFKVDRKEVRGIMLGVVAAGNGGVQNRVGNANLEYFKKKMLPMQAQENGAVLDEEQLLFIAGGQTNTFDEDLDETPIQDFALNKDNVFPADLCDVLILMLMRLLLHIPCSWQIYHQSI
uniref:Integrase, catalytic region, zinc finger, CCHC-type, peptidase aspartic, catalytic n=1 Tax=Tanacetum cinerariifolium TaxID=118510 RepID=A0A6L2LDY6_TANCI|nr:hypothetical protein [Tanacetum cinerariifolium]